MISSKICLVGAFAVGKTSLIKQFVESIFDEKYHTTIGVKIDKKMVSLEENEVQLIIWDIEGVDIFTDLKPSYLRGADGLLFVIDGTRPQTVEAVDAICQMVDKHIPGSQKLLLINKCDLREEWSLDKNQIDHLDFDKERIFETSAKSGENVERAFRTLAYEILNSKHKSVSKDSK
ncbi:MAG: GTP-binding protein [Kangiellaceae bacterium]|nr:GTP-binding protein [Kangiellaceae bacterium]MCW8998651.1 GTP-binding protein [Kangiellaceae bacterium]MCW9017662.1 GTP-binding protein [Kangiellaceae bacterium]